MYYDHTGGNAPLQQRWGTKIAAPLVEAAAAASPRLLRINYNTFTPAEYEAYFKDYDYAIGRVVMPEEKTVTLGGAAFAVLPTPGHTLGHTAYITPDRVAYLGDAIISAELLERLKMPTGADRAREQQTKAALKTLEADAYILAHKEVLTEKPQLARLAQLNLDTTHTVMDSALAALQNGMTAGQRTQSLHAALGVRSRSERPNATFERNLASVMDFLVDSGRVKKTREGGIRRFWKR